MTETPDTPSWDAHREHAPGRPIVPTGIGEEERIERPKRVAVALAIALAGTVCFALVLVIALLHLEEIRDGFITVLNENLEEDYAQEDKERAVHILLAIIGGIALVSALGILVAAFSVLRSKNAAARVFMVVLLVVFLPAAFLTATLREDNWGELLLSGVAAACYAAATVLLLTRRVGQWLHQSDTPPPTPLTDF